MRGVDEFSGVVIGQDAGVQGELLPDTGPQIDDGVVLEGSTAYTGYVYPTRGRGEIFFHRGAGGGLDTFEVYPHDGRDEPMLVTVYGFGGTNEELAQVVALAYRSRAEQLGQAA